MSVDIYVYRVKKVTSAETKYIRYLDSYKDESIVGDEDKSFLNSILRFKTDDPAIKKVPQKYLTRKKLIQFVTNEKKLFHYLGFPEQSINENKIHICKFVNNYFIYSDGIIEKKINYDNEKDFEDAVEIDCYLLKAEILFNSREKFVRDTYEVLKRIRTYYPSVGTYTYEPIDNDMLSRIELPFLIFERNKESYFLYIDD